MWRSAQGQSGLLVPGLAGRTCSLRAHSARNASTPLTPAVQTPTQLLSDGASQDQTLWTLRFSTGRKRGSQLSELAPILLCLTGRQGAAILREILPWPASAESSAQQSSVDQEMAPGNDRDIWGICLNSVWHEQAMAPGNDQDRATAPHRPSLPDRHQVTSQEQAAARRFQEGSVDEVNFIGPDIGPVASLMVAPQQGTWQLDEVTVTSASRRDHSDRFLCREKLGTSLYTAAAILPAVPVDAVPYGSGSTSMILSQEQAHGRRLEGLAGYTGLKSQVLQLSAIAIGLGTVALLALDGAESAAPFLGGGLTGLVYQRLLQLSVDAVPGGPTVSTQQQQQEAPSGHALKRLTSNPQLRILLLAFLGAAALQSGSGTGDPVTSLPRSSHNIEGIHLLLAIVGFLIQQVALLVVAARPTKH